MLGALKKREFGIVSYDPDPLRRLPILRDWPARSACRSFEWNARAPKIVKCELCRERLAAGKEPACTEVCPRNAVIFGRRTDLLRRSAPPPRRVARSLHPEGVRRNRRRRHAGALHFARRVREAWPAGAWRHARPDLARSIQHGVYRDFIAPLALYAALGAVTFRNRRNIPPLRSRRAIVTARAEPMGGPLVTPSARALAALFGLGDDHHCVAAVLRSWRHDGAERRISARVVDRLRRRHRDCARLRRLCDRHLRLHPEQRRVSPVDPAGDPDQRARLLARRAQRAVRRRADGG